MSNYDLLYIITNIFDTYIIYKFMIVFFEREGVNKKVEIISYILYFLCISSAYIFLNIPMITLICNIAVLLLVSFNYKASMKKRILAVLFIYIILISIESIVVLASGYINFSILSINKEYSFATGMIVSKILLYIAALFISNYKNVKNKTVIPYSYWFAVFFIPLTSLYIILAIIEMADINSYKVISIIASLIFVNFFIFYLYDKLSEKQEEKYQKMRLSQQNNYYKKQFELMKASLKSIRSFKHDMKNHLSVLKMLVERNEQQETLKHIDQMVEVLSVTKGYARSGNVIVDSILNFKLQEAEQHGIKVNLELNIPEQLNITSFDMSVILGNLLDNAINAAMKAKEEKNIDIKIKYIKGRLITKIFNTYNGNLNYNGDELITSDEDKENHGIGIKNIKVALDKYNGEMEIEYTENVFTVVLIIYLKD